MNQLDTSAATKQTGFNVDVKRIIFQALRYWYFVLMFFLAAIGTALFKTRYALPIYPITASIVIKEKEDPSQGKLLYDNPLVSGYRNYLNEPYIIRSFPLVERTLQNANFDVAFYREGNVLTTEDYDISVQARVLANNGLNSSSFYFTPINSKQYQLARSADENGKPAVYYFGDSIEYGGLRIMFTIKRDRQDTTFFKSRYLFVYTAPYLLTGSYVGKLGVTWAEEGSGVVNLSISGANPRKELDFLNGLIAEYQRYDLEKKNQAASRTIKFIGEQLTGISDSLHHVERQLERFKDQNFMTNLSQEAERIYKKLEPLEAQKVELQLRSNYYKYLTDYIQSSANLDQVILPTSVGINDPILTGLLSKMIDTQLQLKMNLRPENPLVNSSKKMIREIQIDIIESVKNQQSTDQIKMNFLNAQIRDQEKQLNYLPLAERKMVSIQRNYSLLENLYIFLLQKQAEASISKASATEDITIVNPPMVAGGPISPKPVQNFLIAVVIGLGLPILVFILMEVFNTKIQSKEDVERVTKIPFIAGVGHKRLNNNLEVLTTPKSAIAESFRALRSNLSYFLGKRDNGVFLITSSISGEGKTFTSVNLASVFALSGRKTLIVGADMRKPKLFQDFNLSNNVGLSTYLAGMSGFEEIVNGTSYPALDLISGGPVPPNPAELLLTKRMEEFIQEAKKRYDYIIIDTPPLAIVTDAFALTPYADHILFLVRQNYTPKAFLRAIDDFYSSGKLSNISIVLNDIIRTGPGYGYGDGYGYGYGYGNKAGKSKRNGYGYYSE